MSFINCSKLGLETLLVLLPHDRILAKLIKGTRGSRRSLRVLEFELSFQGHFKLLENENFSSNID